MAPWATALISGWKLDNGNWKPGTPEPIRRSPLAPFPFAPARRAILRAELDAYYARLYGLDRDELRYILDPEDVMGNDYPQRNLPRAERQGNPGVWGIPHPKAGAGGLGQNSCMTATPWTMY